MELHAPAKDAAALDLERRVFDCNLCIRRHERPREAGSDVHASDDRGTNEHPPWVCDDIAPQDSGTGTIDLNPSRRKDERECTENGPRFKNEAVEDVETAAIE